MRPNKLVASPEPYHTWSISKPQVESYGGVISTQHYEASRVGCEILAQGGNAMDAAIAAAFALSVVEPWLSGLGGGGFLLFANANGEVDTLDFGVRAAAAIQSCDYVVEEGKDGDWFNWPRVKNNNNLIGPKSICVPGTVHGLSAALQRYGSLGWDEVIAPTIELAARGMRIDWFAELAIANDRDGLLKNTAAASAFLDQSRRKRFPECSDNCFLRLPRNVTFLERLAKEGADDFYEGEIAHKMLKSLHQYGSRLSKNDLRGYQSEWHAPLSVQYKDRQVYAMSQLSGGPTLLAALASLGRVDLSAASEPEITLAYANALMAADRLRLETMGHAAGKDSCTSHVSVVDRKGNMVALTNTLLSRFGSKVMVPELEILLNNGMMWFDPRRGRPNSIAPGEKPLANMSPVIALRGKKPEIAVGAAGGRKIVPAVAQILSYLVDLNYSPEEAMHAPRIDTSSDPILINRAFSAETLQSIAQHHETRIVEDTLLPVSFAVPSLVTSGCGNGKNIGAAHPNSPWAAAIAES